MRQKIITVTAIILALAGIISLIILFVVNSRNDKNVEDDYTKMKEAMWQIDENSGINCIKELRFVDNQDMLSYKSLDIYAPGEYVVNNSYMINEKGVFGDYTASTAPIIVSADLTDSEIDTFVKNGIVCVKLNSGDEEFKINSPMTVTAFKAAVKYIRNNNKLIPGSSDMIFAVGDSEYAGVCATLGASGDSVAFYTYLDYCGASSSGMFGAYLSDSVLGVICTNSNYPNEYKKNELEWALGLSSTYEEYIKSLYKPELDVDTVAAYKSEVLSIIGKATYSYIYERTYPSEIDGVEYESAEKLIEHLNSSVTWISPDQNQLSYKTVAVTSISDFMKFRETVSGIPDLTSYSNIDFNKMTQADKHKFEICNPMYYLSDYYQGKGTSTPATAWYITSGLYGNISFVQDCNLSKAVFESVKGAEITVSADWSEKSIRNPEIISQWIHGIVFPESENAVG